MTSGTPTGLRASLLKAMDTTVRDAIPQINAVAALPGLSDLELWACTMSESGPGRAPIASEVMYHARADADLYEQLDARLAAAFAGSGYVREIMLPSQNAQNFSMRGGSGADTLQLKFEIYRA